VVNQASGNYQSILLSRLAVLYDKAENRAEAEKAWQQLLSQTQNPALASYWKEKLASSENKGQPEKTPKQN